MEATINFFIVMGCLSSGLSIGSFIGCIIMHSMFKRHLEEGKEK